MRAGETVQAGPWAGFEVLSVYTRKQAIADGELIDVTPAARRAGIKWPVALSRAAWAHVSEGLDLSDPIEAKVLQMRLFDAFANMREEVAAAALRGDADTDRVWFRQGGARLWTHAGPGDDREPVMTIMMEGED